MARKRKLGKRTASGQLSRAKPVKGNDRAQARSEIYGTNGSDAIGRAYHHGLLGSGADAKTLLDTARGISRAYWACYQIGAHRCTLSDRTGAAVILDNERQRAREAWLNRMLATAAMHRKIFDELVIDINPDSGPPWLDRIIARTGIPADAQRFATALGILGDCAGITRLREAA